MPSGQDWRTLQEEEYPPPRARLSRGMILTSSSFLLLIAVLILWPILQFKVNPVSAESSSQNTPTPIRTSDTTPTTFPTTTPTKVPTVSPPPEIATSTLISPSPTRVITSSLQDGLIVLALNEAGYSHLFAFQPTELPYTRLTSGPWDDITPALSPDGKWLAFASNRSGQWDLYLLDLQSGDLNRVTDTPDYDAYPAWSPDGNLLAYETYNTDLEVVIRSVFDDQTFINLSEHPSADFHPTWSPSGRHLAFVSNRSGESEIWLADFDKFGEDRFTNLSQNPDAQESHPAWSPDGSALTWMASQSENHNLYIWKPGQSAHYVASGDWPIWSPDGSTLLTTLLAPDQTLLTAYQADQALLELPPIILPGSVSGLTWGVHPLPSPLPQTLKQISEEVTPQPWTPIMNEVSDVPGGRQHLVELSDVQAPFPQLHDQVDEAFQALRNLVAEKAGWDFLMSLDNAFVPLTSPLPPGMGDDWLYTGRAFAFNSQAMNAGWVVVVPERFGHQTYWRVYLKARFQNGSQGKPLHDLIWDFNARYQGDPQYYENGGDQVASFPPGYWVDFTDLARAFGWERLPALPTWQSAVHAARFNEFLLSMDQTWEESMLDLYPVEALITPTPIFPPTLTPTRTPSWALSSTPSP